MKDTSRVYALRGVAELFVAALCVLFIVVTVWFTRTPGGATLGLCLFGFMTLTADGIVTLEKSRKIAKFR